MLFGPLLWRWLNPNGTFVSELPLIVSQRSSSLDLREAGRWSRICHGRMRNVCFLTVMRNDSMVIPISCFSDKKQLRWKQFLSAMASLRSKPLWQMTRWLKSSPVPSGTECTWMFCLVKWDWLCSGVFTTPALWEITLGNADSAVAAAYRLFLGGMKELGFWFIC